MLKKDTEVTSAPEGSVGVSATVWAGHGNRMDNPNETWVYKIYMPKPYGKEFVLKFGITSYTPDPIRRPRSQMPELRMKYGPTVTYDIILSTPNRSIGLWTEDLIVSYYRFILRERLPEQNRPLGNYFKDEY